jgi:hypothetical protein
MPDERWVWDPTTGRYRNERGRFLPAARLQELRDRLLEAAASGMASLADQLAEGKQTVGDWERAMREAIKALFGAQYVFGRGGMDAMRDADWDRLADLVETQHECLANDRCAWVLRRRADGNVEATWLADLDRRTCKTCRGRARKWNPLILTPGQPAPTESPTSSKLRTPSRTAVEV